MSDEVTLTIDGREVTVPAGTTIYDAARAAGIDIPIICYHPNLTANGLCRVCSVDVGWRVFAAACVTPVAEGMEVKTQTDEVCRSRRTILEMLDATVDLEESPQIQAMLAEYEAEPGRFQGRAARNAGVRRQPVLHSRLQPVHQLLALRAGLWRRRPVYLCAQL
jgi:hypothetical protein